MIAKLLPLTQEVSSKHWEHICTGFFDPSGSLLQVVRTEEMKLLT